MSQGLAEFEDPGIRQSGHLEVGDGHRVYWETCGTEDAPAALVLHGGPGSGCTAAHRQLFDPARHNVALMDQRGCGRSTPDAAETQAGLLANTTAHLIDDIERLRVHLDVEDWLLVGGSWGVTLAQAYAARHPDRVRAMVLAGVTACRARELQWLYWDVRALFPDAHAAFRRRCPSARTAAELITGYTEALWTDDADAAATEWCQWEAALVSPDGLTGRWADAKFRRRFARIVTHYFAQDAFLGAEGVIPNVQKIAHIPAVLIHSRFDPSAPLETAWLLSQSWQAARLQVLGGAVHGATEGEMGAAVRGAIDRFSRDAGSAKR